MVVYCFVVEGGKLEVKYIEFDVFVIVVFCFML